MRESMSRRTVKKADEWDVTSWMRHYLGYLEHPGVTHAVKRRLSRRYRHEAKHQLRRDF